jgi:two-component system cell cycle sensor histidine kinase/response regulator CckA
VTEPGAEHVDDDEPSIGLGDEAGRLRDFAAVLRDEADAARNRARASHDSGSNGPDAPTDASSADRVVMQQHRAAPLAGLTDALWTAAFEQAPVGVFEIDFDGRILRANATMDRLLEYPSGVLEGTLIADHADPDERPAGASRFVAGVVAAGFVDGVPLHFRTRSGADCWANGTGLLVAGAHDGPDRILSYIVDVTGAYRYRARIAAANERIAALLEHSSDAILVLSASGGEVMYASPGLTAITGMPSETLMGTSLRGLVHPDDLPGTRAAVARIVADPGRAGTIECRVRHVDGAWRNIEATAVNLIDDPAVKGIVANLTDVTERVEAAALIARQALEANEIREAADKERHALEERLSHSERLESLGQLAGGIAHDFNNLLGVILNYSEFVIEQSEALPQVRADAAQIQAAAERAAALTHQLLTFARRETIQLVPLDLNAVVANMHSLLLRSLGEHVSLRVRAGTDVPQIRADAGQMEQVLVNLAVNARDAMPSGGTLMIETRLAVLDAEFAHSRPDLEPGVYAELAVSDTGTGMSPELIARIFEPFFTTKPQGQGTGLGLSTLYGIVRSAGGSVNVYSEEGTGTTFRVFLPAIQSVVPAAPPSQPDFRGHGEAILVVEDEPALLEVTSRMLRRGGYEVTGALTHQAALASAAESKFQLLLSDVVMPEMMGPDLAAQVHAMQPDIEVLFMSGYSAGVLGPGLFIDDGVALIQKPLTQVALLEKVREALVGAC